MDSNQISQDPSQPMVMPPQDKSSTNVMPKGGPKPKWQKIGLWVSGAIALAAVGWWAYTMLKPTPEVSEVKNDIPLFRYGLEEGPLNTFYPSSEPTISEFHVNEQIFEGLVRFDNGTQVVPLLAESWTNPDSSTWIFKLKQGVKFHNGHTLDARDVEASLENYKDTPFGSLFNITIKDVEPTSDYEVKITTDGPDPILLNRLAFLFIIDSEATVENSDQNGTGPYVVKPGTTPSAKALNLVAWDEYHGGHIYTRELNIEVIEKEADRIEALKTSKVNMTVFEQQANVSELKNMGYKPLETQDLTVWSLIINHVKTGPLQKLALRQALYQAIDAEPLIKASDSNGISVSQFIPPSIPGYNPEIKRPEYNLEVAKELLKNAGYPNGLTLSLDYYAPRKAVVEEIAAQLAKIGVTINLVAHDDSNSLIDTLVSGEADLIYIAPGTDTLDGADASSLALQNPNYSNPEVDKLLAEANKTFDSAQRLDLLKQISKLAADDVAVIPLYHSTSTYLMDKPYAMQLDVVGYLGVYFWQVYATE